MSLSYAEIERHLVAALPELRQPVERLRIDWFSAPGETEPPGQYIVLSDTYSCGLHSLIAAEPTMPQRERLLQRFIDFGERMMACEQPLRSLGIDALGETLQQHSEGGALVVRFGGPALSRWWASYGGLFDSVDEAGPIDIWGVREALVAAAPGATLTMLPGISHPADHRRLDALQSARGDPAGRVLLAAFGTSHPLLVASASSVACSETDLQDLAKRLAEARGGETPNGSPAPTYWQIPLGERVWNMDEPHEPHKRLTEDIWIHPSARRLTSQALAVIAGRRPPARR